MDYRREPERILDQSHHSRMQTINIRLNEIIDNYHLPNFEDIVKHLRDEYSKTFSNQDSALLDNPLPEDSRINSQNLDEEYSIENFDYLLKQLLQYTSLLICDNNIDEKFNSFRQNLCEKSAVYILWIFYHLLESHGSIERSFFSPNEAIQMIKIHQPTLEFVFDSTPLNLAAFVPMFLCSRSLFRMMDFSYLNEIFFYSMAIQDVIENSEFADHSSIHSDWFDRLVSEHENICHNLPSIDESKDDENNLGFEVSLQKQILKHLIRDNFDCDESEYNVEAINSDSGNKQRTLGAAIAPENCLDQNIEDVLSALYNEINDFILQYALNQKEEFFLRTVELYNTILNWIVENQADDHQISEEMTNLLGNNSMNLITKIITFYKPRIAKRIKEMANQPSPSSLQQGQSSISNKKTDNLKRAEHLWQLISKAKAESSSVRPSIVVNTAREKALAKEMKKIEKKYNKELNKIQKEKNFTDEIYMTDNNDDQITIQQLQKMREKNLKQSIRTVIKPIYEEQFKQYKPREKYPFVFVELNEIKSSASYVAETKLVLPIDSQRIDRPKYEEISIPLITKSSEIEQFLQSFPRIEIKDTDEFVRIGFKDFSTLNIIQSTVFKTAYYNENQNLLICAPTGAGKTEIAMLSILNVLRLFSKDDDPRNIDINQFKIIYIAPMKALCAEMTSTFARRLEPFGVKVRESTGDTQLTQKEIMGTQMLVVTPEKWDVITRKSVGDVQLMDLVRLIIIDEIHLLQSDRGHVLETLVARTIRYIEQTQKLIRLVGLSATLPNYVDVAQFLHVDFFNGLFVFDERFRTVPLSKTFIGCKSKNNHQLLMDMDEITMQKTKEILKKENQVMIFVHSRNSTMQLANYLIEKVQYNNTDKELAMIFKADFDRLTGSEKLINRARYRNLDKFLLQGIGIHHAGMPRSERNIVEKLFKAGVIKILVCTSTLAWGVNLPAHSVIIRGTEYYDSARGYFVDIDMLDVLQIFGRAGRPQYDTEGEATIITKHDKLAYYLRMLTNQSPIESHFMKHLTDNLNAEIVLGTIANIAEAMEWIRYTYFYIRMQKNPLEYGLKSMAAMHLPLINEHLLGLIRNAAEQLDQAQMVRYNPEHNGTLDPTHLGRIASHFYLKHETILHLNDNIRTIYDTGKMFEFLSNASEFQQLKCRDEEIKHLEKLFHACKFHVKGELTNTNTKVNILMQNVINRGYSDCHSLNSDLMYITQNVSRITRGMFEYVLKRGWPLLAEQFLTISLMFEKQIWDHETPFRQFEQELTVDVMRKLTALQQSKSLHVYDFKDMTSNEIGDLIRDRKYGPIVKRLSSILPNIQIEATVRPITRTILTVCIQVKPDFVWEDRYHGKTAQIFWIWLSDFENNHIYHAESCRFTKKQVVRDDVQNFIFTIPLLDASHLQKQYLIHSVFEYWLGSENQIAISCENLILPDKLLPNTALLNLMPLPIKALNNPLFESLYPFQHFNPIQTQIFHCLYHTDQNILLGAPTGSGKTIAAEIALFRVLNNSPEKKIVYIAPLKALVRERVDDWRSKFHEKLGLHVVELTGDVTPDIGAIDSSNIIVTTPEKWDGVSRGWTFRKFVRQVALIIIDEIHLLGEDRGPVLEVIVSRTNLICSRTCEQIRIVGLSTAIANAQDLAAWLRINKNGLYNFSPSVRPVPIEVHVSGFSEKHYCPRMASMNKPTYRAIKQYSPEKPVIVFVSSRRQTRLTALDLITLIASDEHSNVISFFRYEDLDEFEDILQGVKDSYLKHTLRFGIGLHHAGLIESDRKLVEHLFLTQRIQVLITTATLAWGINLPAHAVVIKGTEFFDGKKGKYVDFPITDVLQMIGRAGRPQFDTSAVAVLFVQDIKKEYYRKFLYEPFPVESHLLDVFPDHLNAEIVAGTVRTKHEAMQYLSSTYLYHRIIKNPSYYGVDLSDVSDHSNENEINTQIIQFLSGYIDRCVEILKDNFCIVLSDSDDDFDNQEECYDRNDFLRQHQTLTSTPFGKIASFYYLSYHTIRLFQDKLSSFDNGFEYHTINDLLELLTMAVEFSTLPVRHNEELLNQDLNRICPIKLDRKAMDSPHTKTNLLIQAHCSRLPLPIVDYYTDLKTVLDQIIRILQAMIDISAINGSLPTTINIINLQQCILQGSWQNSNQIETFLSESINVSRHNGNFSIYDDSNDAQHFYDDSRRRPFESNVEQLPEELTTLPILLQFIYELTLRSSSTSPQREFESLFAPYPIHNHVVANLFRSLLNLPLINMEDFVIKKINRSPNEFEEVGVIQHISKEESFKSKNEMKWIHLESNADYMLTCKIKKLLFRTHTNKFNVAKINQAFCPRFPKQKYESWYLILGCREKSELIAMTRLANIDYRYGNQINLKFHTPKVSSQRVIYEIYLLSDSYIGLDQQYCLPLEID
ncbi:homeodomain protein EmxB [Sarcoptes scabiei]|nr:homeodomain protein EmxB [Sarcoptes scabiei]